jgi:hypothetical protein
MEKARHESLGTCCECHQELVNTYVMDMGDVKNPLKFHLMCFLRKINLRVRL